ncbi:MAG: class I SAM-dependent methyltransferase [Candidatus Methylomirabilales bacterium]
MMGCAQWLRAQFGRPTGFWGRVAGIIMANRRQNRERNAWTIALLDLQQGDRVLEIGFGPGVAIHEMSQIVSEGLVAGIDHSETMVRQAQKRNAAAIREGRLDVRLGTVSALPAFNAPFDKCVAVNTIQFWDEPVERLKELRRLLRAGGLIAITEEPRFGGATDDSAQVIGQEMVAALTKAGFSQVRLETKKMKPVSAVCALGVNSPGGS